MKTQNDIPRKIAGWLFVIGSPWAILLAPIVISGLFFSQSSRGWAPFMKDIALYLLVGFGVWLGWLWRGRRKRSLSMAAAFWLFSAAYNSALFVLVVVKMRPSARTNWTQWMEIFIPRDWTILYVWWWIIATLASLVALLFEFALSRDEQTAMASNRIQK